MPVPFNNLLGFNLLGSARLNQFLSGIDAAIDEHGVFAAGQPTTQPYVIHDPAIGEMVWLWRTKDDERAQLKYRQYREIKKLGFGSAVKRLHPELYRPNKRNKREQPVRAYDFLSMLSSNLSTLVNGRGVEVKTGIERLDEVLRSMKLEAKLMAWTNEASTYERVGIEAVFDAKSQTMDVVRILPDHLYIHKRSGNQSEIEFIAKRFFVPMEAVPEWEPVTIDTRTREGLEGVIARDQARAGQSGFRQGVQQNKDGTLTVRQDGFVYEERHYRGWVEYSFYASSGNRILCVVPMELYDEEKSRNPVKFTGMGDFAITLYENVGDDGEARSDWDSVFDGVVDYSRRSTLNGRLVDRYSEPREVVPASMIQTDPITGRAQMGMGDGEAIVVRPTDQMKPELLQPNANFDAPSDDLSAIRSHLGLLSSARYVMDPDILGNVDAGVALKLKMSPALSRVMPRRTAQEEAVKTVVLNIISALEYHTSTPTPADSSPHLDNLALSFGGVLAGEVEQLLRKAKVTAGSKKISISNFAGVFRHAYTEQALDRQAEGWAPEEVEARDFFLRSPAMGSPTMDEGGQVELDAMQIGPNTIDRRPMPEMIPGQDIQRQADAISVASALIDMGKIMVRFRPGLPQDEAEARQEVAEGVRSVFSFLTEVKGLTEAEAEEELQRINEDQSTAVAQEDLGGGGPFDTASVSNPLDRADALAIDSAMMRVDASRMAPGAHLQQDSLPTALQATPS